MPYHTTFIQILYMIWKWRYLNRFYVGFQTSKDLHNDIYHGFTVPSYIRLCVWINWWSESYFLYWTRKICLKKVMWFHLWYQRSCFFLAIQVYLPFWKFGFKSFWRIALFLDLLALMQGIIIQTAFTKAIDFGLCQTLISFWLNVLNLIKFIFFS